LRIVGGYEFYPSTGWRASKNLYPSRSKAPRVIDPPSLLGLFQVLKFKRERDLLTNSLQENHSQSMLGKDLEESRLGVNAR
jgi:hypothetical protein